MKVNNERSVLVLVATAKSEVDVFNKTACGHVEYWLSQGKIIRKEALDNEFHVTFFFLNEGKRQITESDVSEEVKTAGIEMLRILHRETQQIKASYKQKVEEHNMMVINSGQ